MSMSMPRRKGLKSWKTSCFTPTIKFQKPLVRHGGIIPDLLDDLIEACENDDADAKKTLASEIEALGLLMAALQSYVD